MSPAARSLRTATDLDEQRPHQLHNFRDVDLEMDRRRHHSDALSCFPEGTGDRSARARRIAPLKHK